MRILIALLTALFFHCTAAAQGLHSGHVRLCRDFRPPRGAVGRPRRELVREERLAHDMAYIHSGLTMAQTLVAFGLPLGLGMA
jgi:hypothetical protein